MLLRPSCSIQCWKSDVRMSTHENLIMNPALTIPDLTLTLTLNSCEPSPSFGPHQV